VKYAPLQIPSSFANIAEAGLLMLPFGRMHYQLQYERKILAASTWITAEQLPCFATVCWCQWDNGPAATILKTGLSQSLSPNSPPSSLLIIANVSLCVMDVRQIQLYQVVSQ
jgi:hypothetical protein